MLISMLLGISGLIAFLFWFNYETANKKTGIRLLIAFFLFFCIAYISYNAGSIGTSMNDNMKFGAIHKKLIENIIESLKRNNDNKKLIDELIKLNAGYHVRYETDEQYINSINNFIDNINKPIGETPQPDVK